MTAQPFTLAELVEVLRVNAGVEDGVDLDGDIQEQQFIDLGYDSLALLQVLGYIKREHGIVVPDDAVADVETPQDLVKLINESAPVAV